MYDSKSNFAENKHYYKIVEAENISKDDCQSKKYSNDSGVSLSTSDDVDSSTLKQTPTKLYQLSREEFKERLRRKRILRKRSRNRIERHGRTNSSSFMVGLQTFIDTCGLLEKRDIKSKSNLRNEAFFHSPPQAVLLIGNNASHGECSTSRDNRHASARFCQPYSIYTMNPVADKPQFLTYNAKTKTKKGTAKKTHAKIKTPSHDPEITQSDNATQVSCGGPCEQTVIGRDYSKLSLRRRSIDDDIHEYWNNRNRRGSANTLPSITKERSLRENSETNLTKYSSQSSVIQSSGKYSSEGDQHVSCVRVNKDDGKVMCVKFDPEASLTATMFPPFEISPCNKTCELLTNFEKPRHSHKKSRHGKPLSFHNSSTHDPMMLINKDCSACFKPGRTAPVHVDVKKSRHIPIVQPVVGYCNMGKQTAHSLRGIKYALVKISEFLNYKTYEVMTPYRNPPKDMPTCIAEIFVISREKNGTMSSRPIVKRSNNGTETLRIHHKSL